MNVATRRASDWAVALLLGLAGALAAMVVVAITVAVVDIYLAGHNRPTLVQPWLERPELGIHLSRADLLLIVAAAGAGVWFTRATLSRRRARRGASRPEDR